MTDLESYLITLLFFTTLWLGMTAGFILGGCGP